MGFNQDSFTQFPAYRVFQQDQPWFRATWESEIHAAENHSTDLDLRLFNDEIQEDIPQLNDIAAIVLRNPFDETNFEAIRELARSHGRARSRSRAFTLHHLICEYQILRTVIFNALEKANCLQPTTLQRVERQIDEAMMHATIVYTGLVQERLLTVQKDLTNNLINVDMLKNRYETALLATGDVIWEWDLTNGEMIANEAIESTFKHPLSTVQPTATWWFSHVHPDDLARVQKSLADFFPSHQTKWSMEYRFRRGDQTFAEICSKAYIRRDEKGTPISFMGAMQDISDTKTLERELKTQNERLEAGIRERTAFLNAILDNLEDGIAACDTTKQVTTTNRALLKIFGESPATTQATAPTPLWLQHSLLYVADGSRPMRTDETGLFRAVAGETVRGLRSRAVLPNGEVRHLESDAQPLIADDGRPIGAVVIVHDRTAEVVAASEREELSEQNRSLKISEDQLKRSNTELESFAAVAAHDLKSPLCSISQFAEILIDDYKGKIGSEADEILDYIKSASLRMRTLIDSLLNYAKSGAGLEIEKDLDANFICQSAVENLSATIRSHNAKVRCSHLPHLRADPNRLLQVLQNLIGNGIKYCRENTPAEIDIEAFDEGDKWRIEVGDNGMGICSKDSTHVFDFFKRLNTDSPREGTGIGLAVCKRIVESHGGSIWIEPQPVFGTRVCFTLPKEEAVLQ